MTKVRQTIAAVTLLAMIAGLDAPFPGCSARTTTHPAAATDWSVALVESTIKRNPTGESFKGWG